MRLNYIVCVTVIWVMSETAIAQRDSDILFESKASMFRNYEAAAHHTLLRLEPLFKSYAEAKNQGDTAAQNELHQRIALRNTLGDWRWRFYQYGLKNPQTLSPREKAVWVMVDKQFEGQSGPTSPEEMLKFSPEQIRESLIQERKAFDEALAEFDKSVSKPEAPPVEKNPASRLPQNVETYLRDEKNSVTEDNFLPSTLPSSLDFIRSVTSNWRVLLNEIPRIAPEGRQQALIVVAGEFLPPQEYLHFVNHLCDLRFQGRLLPESLRSVLWASMAKSGFLAYNYDQPEVRPVIARLQTQMEKDYPNDWNDFFGDLNSGKMKIRLVERRTREGDPMPEEILNYDETPYHHLSGGSVKADLKLIAKNPIQAVTSLASSNRSLWSMIAAMAAIIGMFAGGWALLLKIKRRAKRKKESCLDI